jgi:transposase
VFKKARDMAAWLGLVPRQYSTGGKTTLLGISKRGNKYLRRMDHPWSPVVRDASRSIPQSYRRLARRPSKAHAREQGYRRFGRQDRSYCMGGDDQARRKL